MNTDHNAAQNAEALMDKLNQSISETVLLRGSYADDIRHFTRNRKLPMEELIKLLLTMTGGPLNRELYDAGIDIALFSFIERRKDVSYGCFRDIMLRFNDLCDDTETIKGYRLLAIDGSTVPLPRNADSKNHYTSETNTRGWNNIHCNLLLDILNQVFVDCYAGEGDSRKSHDEQGALYSLIYKRSFDQPTIVVLDRGYEGYNTIAHLSQIPNLYYVLRVKNDGLRPVRDLPMEELDKNLVWKITNRQTSQAKQNRWIFIQSGSRRGKTISPNTRNTRWDYAHIDPYPMQCRAVRFRLSTDTFETLLTNLPSEEFSLSDLQSIYAMRWNIELSIRF